MSPHTRHVRPADAAVILAALDPATRLQVRRRANSAAARLLRHTLAGDPPGQHATPVLALARAIAGAALLFGDPMVIDLVAKEARIALDDDNFTIRSIFEGAGL